MGKVCSNCGNEFDLSMFYKDKRKVDGLYPACKDCHSIRTNRWRDSNREKNKAIMSCFRVRHRDKINDSNRARQNELTKNLSDRYIKVLLMDKGFERNQITDELIELNRSIIKIKRYGNQQNNGN